MEGSWSRIRSAVVRSASTSRPRSSSSLASEYGGSWGTATRQEPKAIVGWMSSRVGADEAARQLRLLQRPHGLAVELDPVLVRRAGLEVADLHHAVVVALHGERGRGRAQHAHLARLAGLDPDHGAGLVDVAQEGSENEISHRGGHTRSAPGTVLSVDLEPSSIQAIGTEIHDALPRPSRNPVKVVDARAMEMASRDEELRSALFRLVDVTPACRSTADLARHLTAYLEEVPERPPALDAALRAAHAPGGARALGRATAVGVRHMAHRFIAGETPKKALGEFQRLWEAGRGQLGRPAGRGHGDHRRGRPLRRPLPRRAGHRRAGRGPLAGPRGAGARLAGRHRAGQRVGQDLGAHAPHAPRGAAGGPRRRRGAAAPAAAAGQGAGRLPAHRHGVGGLAGDDLRPDLRRAGRGRVPRRARGRAGAAGLPARVAPAARAGAGLRPRAPAAPPR